MQTAMGIAAMMGHKFSVVTVLSRILPMIENEAAVYGMIGKLASARSVDIPVLELEKDLAATKRALIAEAKRAVLDGGRRLHHLRLHPHARLRRRGPRRPAPRRSMSR